MDIEAGPWMNKEEQSVNTKPEEVKFDDAYHAGFKNISLE